MTKLGPPEDESPVCKLDSSLWSQDHDLPDSGSVRGHGPCARHYSSAVGTQSGPAEDRGKGSTLASRSRVMSPPPQDWEKAWWGMGG